ncbi:MAG TPA: hypothetical protein VFF30_12495 [Nitrososphaerales archaeon]|nr:hypothetical protein [Nitrososphaerales archaeon]
MIVKVESATLVAISKASFVFWIGIFALEAFLDINPTRLMVSGTAFSVSYYVYVTLPDLVRFFPLGFLALGAVGALFAFRKYWAMVPATGAFFASFYFEIVRSSSFMSYYKSNYACHLVPGRYGFSQYFCPLQSMVSGSPNIPLQGNVLALVAFALAMISFGVFRSKNGLRSAIVDTLIAASSVVLIFESGIYAFQYYWFPQHVTYYQGLLGLRDITNANVFDASLAILLVSVGVKAWNRFRQSKKYALRTIPPPKIAPIGGRSSPR